MFPGPVVDAEWLAQHREDVRIVDVRWYLSGKRGADEYARGHLPGAVFLDLEKDLTASSGPGRHPIPSAPAFQAAMRKAGVGRETNVVAYDDAGGSIAARVWWLLRRFGHPASRAAILDGGIAAWTAAGHALATDVPSPVEGDFVAKIDDAIKVVDKKYVDAARAERDVVVLDARTAERYRGDVEPIDARPGHIPGAASAPFANNLAGGRYRAPEELRVLYTQLGVDRAREVIVYCGSGVTACHDLLAIERAGFPLPTLYEGSWSDWAKDHALPAAKGDA